MRIFDGDAIRQILNKLLGFRKTFIGIARASAIDPECLVIEPNQPVTTQPHERRCLFLYLLVRAVH
jgi:ABC-type taurine transport system ATPase subunit